MENQFYRYEGQLETLRSQMLMAALGSLILATYGVYLFWAQEIKYNLILWFTALLISCSANSILAIKSKHLKGESAFRALNLFTALGMIAGLIWAIPAYWVASGQPEVLQPEFGSIFIVISVMGMATAAMGSTSAYLPFYYCSVSPFALSLLIACFSSDGALFKEGELAFILLIFFAAIYWFTFYINRSLVNAIELKHANGKLAQDYLNEKNKAEQAHQQQSYFLAAASHDLRQPLQSLVLHCELLTDEVPHARGKSILKNAQSSVASLTNLFNALLDISKLESGTLKVVKSDFNLIQLFDNLSANYQELALEHNVELTFSTRDLWVKTDFILLQRCISNLLDNALAHAHATRILVAAREYQGKVLLYVMDNGIGVKEPDKKRIFNRFEQLNNPERDRKKGGGLGLSIVESVFALLNHEFQFSSQFKRGVKFVIELPKGQQVKQQVRQKEEIFDSNFSLLNGRSIWLIENDDIVENALRMMLTHWGANVTVITDKSELESLLSHAEVKCPELVISDYRLANHVNGCQLIQRIRERFNYEVPAVVITGETSQEKITLIKATGIPLLHKPVTGAKLRLAMQHLLLSKHT